MGEKKKIKRKNGKKNLDDLRGLKRRKVEEKMAKKPTAGLIREKKKAIKSKNGQKHLHEDL